VSNPGGTSDMSTAHVEIERPPALHPSRNDYHEVALHGQRHLGLERSGPTLAKSARGWVPV
jgi:hypothetical protein